MAKSAQSTYLQYLPAIFQRRPEPDPEKSGSEQERVPFLGQFLRPFEDAIGSFEAVLAVVDRSFSPAFAQAGDFLPWLASWIALVLDEEWAEDRRRRLLAEAMQLYQWRGTIAGLKRYLEIYTELEPEAIEIRECRLPAGMQIGVASRIGGVVRQKTPGASERAARRDQDREPGLLFRGHLCAGCGVARFGSFKAGCDRPRRPCSVRVSCRLGAAGRC